MEWQTLFNAVDSAVWVLDENQRIIETNDGAQTLFGQSERDMKGRPCWEIFYNGNKCPVEECPFARSRKSLEKESASIGAHGRWFDVVAAPLLTDNRQWAGAVLIITDVTDQRTVEEERNLYRDVLNDTQHLARIGGWQWDVLGRKSFWTDALYRLHGVDPEQAPPESFDHFARSLSCFDAQDRPVIQVAFSRCIRVGEPYDFDFPFTRATGERIFIRTAAKPIFRQGRLEKVIGIVMDITDRKLAEDRALAQAERRRIFFNAVDDAIFVHPLQETGFAPFTEVNEIACRRYGYSEEEFYRLSVPDITLKDDADRHSNPVHRRHLFESKHQVFETVHIKKSGEHFPVEINSNIVYQRGIPYILAVVRDITDRKTAEEEREKLQSQLIQAQKMESVGRLAGGVAHDFNNMLSVILGNTELALEEANNCPRLHEMLKEIESAAMRSASVTQQLLAFARKQPIVPRVLDLNHTVAGMFKMLQRLIGEDIILRWQPAKGLWPVKIDPSQVDQILANLCINARDAITGQGRLTIETENISFDDAYCALHPLILPGDFVKLSVSDNGCGMDPQTMENLFEPFFTTKDGDTGTGLGLATVYGIVKQNRGTITVASEKNQGTTFRIFLPRHMDADDPVADRMPGTGHLTGTETVMLVEDEPYTLKMTRVMLEHLGYRVLTESSPRKALQFIKRHAGDIHLLMTDVVMPEMNGQILVTRVKAFIPGLKTLFMSGYTANEITRYGVLEGHANFIAKPFSIKQLSLKVREILDTPAENTNIDVDKPQFGA